MDETTTRSLQTSCRTRRPPVTRLLGTLLAAATLSLPGTASAQSGETMVVRVGTLTPAFPVYWGVFAAQDLGYYKDQRVDVQFIKVNNDSDCIRALASASLEACTSGVDAIVHAADARANVRIIAGLLDRNPGVLIGAPSVQRIPDLKGKRIAVFNPEEGSTLAMFALLAEAGLTRKDFDTISVGGGGPRFAALKAAQAQATMLPPPNSFIALDAGFVRLGNSAASPASVYGTVIAAIPGRDAKTDEALKRLVTAIRRANTWINDATNRKAAIEMMSTGLLKIQPQYAERTYQLIVEESRGISPDARPSLDTIANVMRLMATYTRSKGKQAAAAYVDERYLR